MPRFWELAPNWREPYNVNHEFRTDIIQSRTKREQRNALRAEPRKSLSFTVTCTKDRYRTLQRSLAAGSAQGESWYVPEVTEGVAVDAAAAAGQSTISPVSVPFWMAAGRPVVIMFGTRHELAVIDHLSGGNLVMEDNFTTAWPLGTKIAPARTAYVAVEVSGENATNNTIELTVNFSVEVGLDLEETPAAAAVTFNGREVLLKKPNWKEAVADTFRSARESIDYGQGRMAHFLPATFPTTMRKAAFLNRTALEAEALRQFFLRMKGQQGEFYMPSGTQDIVPSAQLTSGQATMTIAGTAFAEAYEDDTVHRAVAVVLTNGTTLYRVVDTIAVVSGNSRITFTANWPSTIPVASIVMVSWMPAWRLSSDLLTFEWLTDAVAQVAITMQTVEDLAGD